MGYDHCAWLADDGSVWTSGENYYGQLGFGDDTDRNRPSRVPNLPPISSVQSGYRTTLCLDNRGNLWSFGFNGSGQLGLGDTTDRVSPEMVPGIPPVCSFSFHYFHVICLCEDASIWVFGHNNYGQLGLGHENPQSAPVHLPSSCFPDQITSVECGYGHSAFLTCKGQVLACGNNQDGQLGLGDSTDRSIPILNPKLNKCVQISCGGNMSCMVDGSHRLWVCGSYKGSQETPLCIPSVGLIQNISVGYQHTLCINQSGELWGWGDPSFGQLGNGTRRCANPILLNTNIYSCLCLGYSSFIRNASGKNFCCGRSTTGHVERKQVYFCEFPEGEKEEQFRMCFPVGIRKFSQKSARSALPLPE